MYRLILSIAAVVLISSFSTGCDPYRKLSKSKNIADKDSAAMHYFQEEKYEQASYLLEELLGVYRPTSRGEEIYYYYAYCRFHMGELVSAAYYFEDFVRQYPQSKHAEEFRYKHAYCHYLLSDPWYLDQKYTRMAIEKIQLFLSRYPYSTHKPECEKMLVELREKLARKAFEQASLYYKISYHKAAVEAFQNMMNEYPDSKYIEEADFLLVSAAYKLAGESTKRRKKERYVDAVEYGDKFVEKYPESERVTEIGDIKSSAEKFVSKIDAEEALAEEEKLFLQFKRLMETALKTPETGEAQNKYRDAMKPYEKLKKLNPESEFLADAEKYFRKFETKYP